MTDIEEMFDNIEINEAIKEIRKEMRQVLEVISEGNMRARNDVVFVEVFCKEKDNKIGSIYVPEMEDKKSDTAYLCGKVISSGKGIYDYHYTRDENERKWVGIKGGLINLGETQPNAQDVIEHNHFIPNNTKPGDIVLFPKYVGDNYGENIRIIRECQIDAIIEDYNDEEIDQFKLVK